MGFTVTPNLPKQKVSKIIAGQGIISYLNELKKLNVEVIICDENPLISSSLRYHADLTVNYLGNGNFLLDKSQKSLSEKLKLLGYNVEFINKSVKDGYPYDSALNATLTADTVICNYIITADELKDFINKNNYNIVSTNQGYSKCSVCAVTNNAFITDDESIYKELKKQKYDVLYVKKGSIALDGFNYGFIGGCCGKLSDSIIAFCGDISRHSDYDSIKAFVKNYNIELLSLGKNIPVDIGSIIPIYEIDF